MKVGYLGPKTNSENAVKEYAAHVAGLGIMAYPSMDYVFDALCTGKVDRIIIPVRNSITGDIGYQKLVDEHHLQKIDELSIRINHCIAAKNTNKNTRVKAVLSHIEALRQCQFYLDQKYAYLERIAVESTNEAARIASIVNGCAAIANLESCLNNGLKILDEDIVKGNFSTFWVVKCG